MSSQKNTIDNRLYADQVHFLYLHQMTSLLTNLAGAVVLVVVLWPLIDQIALLVWLAAIVAVTSARSILAKYYFATSNSWEAQCKKWGILFSIGFFLSGTVWGTAGIFLFPVHSLPHQIFILFMLGGFSIGASAATTAVKHLFYLYLVPALLPLTVRFFMAEDGMYGSMGIMILLFVGGYSFIASRISRITREAFLLKFENEREIFERQKAEAILKVQQQKLESLVAERTIELELRNKELQQEKEKLEMVTESVGAGLAIISKEYRTLWANRILTDIYGDVIGKICYKTYNKKDTVCDFCGVRKVFEQGELSVHTETVGMDKDGKTTYSEIIATPIYDEEGNISAALEIVLPITEGKQREKALAELFTVSKKLSSTSELGELYRMVSGLAKELLQFDFSTLMILSDDKKSLVIRDTIGFPRESIGTYALVKGQGLSTYVIEQKIPAIVEDFKTEERFEIPSLIDKFGIRSSLCVPMMIGDEVFGVLIGHSLERKTFSEMQVSLFQGLANQAAVAIKNFMHLHSLQLSEKKFRTLFDSTNDAIMIFDLDGSLIEVNKVTCERLGYSREELLHLDKQDFVAPQYVGLIKERVEMLQQVETAIFETAHIKKDGTVIPVEMSCKLIDYDNRQALLGIARDISERKERESELLRAQKLESVGVLAGGIAHDFNNLLTGILGNIGMAKMTPYSEDEFSSFLADMEKATLRARDLTQQLLTFSKGGAPVKKIVSVVDVVKESSGFAIRGATSRCEYDFAGDLWKVDGDKGQLGQVFQNLVINSSQSMTQGGVIHIKASNVDLQENEILPLEAGPYVKISVTDQGAGIARENLEKIFDPYFSTKSNGSGLGLAVVYSIIKNHDGHIVAHSEAGVGTTFTVYLPAISEKQKEVVPADARKKVFTGKGKILVMDDEVVVRKIAARILTKLGFEVMVACDGQEAINFYEEARQAGNPFDAVIMDLTVPGGMGGQEAMSHLQEIDPHITAIVSSGYANDPVMANFEKAGFKGVVPKPFTLEEFGNVLERALGEK